jgi:hypothetical protein
MNWFAVWYLASFQMTVILWHLLCTVIQCEPERMKEVRAATGVLIIEQQQTHDWSNNINKQIR